jgi:hypothetical protein
LLAIVSLTGCGKKDTVLDFGGGDSIRLGGASDVFDCDDPKYAKVKKDEVYDVHFADGKRMRLCRESAAPK